MQIEQFDPDMLIQGLLDTDTYINRVGGSCIYGCPRCGHRIRFRWRNFYKADEHTTLTHAIRQQFDSLSPDNPSDEQGFLDFVCPTCQTPTRIIFSIDDYTELAFHYDIKVVLVGQRES